MSTTNRRSAIQNLCTIIKRFKFEELELAVMPHFPETSWRHVRETLMENKKTFTSKNVALVIERILMRSKIHATILQDRSATLQVIGETDYTAREVKPNLTLILLSDISRHHNRRIWVGYVMTGPRKVPPKHPTQLQDNIKDRFHSINKQIDVKIEIYNCVTYVYLNELNKKPSARNSQAAFFALFIDQKHFFCTKNAIAKDFVKVITVCLGHATSKKLKLTGRDVRSLDKLYRRKQQGAIDIYDVDGPPVYKDASPNMKSTGVDFTQQKQRRKYAEKCFSDDPANLELLVLNTKDQPWIDEELSSKLPNRTIQMTWEFRGANITNYLTKLIERRIVITPLPEYILNLMKLGKNELTITRT